MCLAQTIKSSEQNFFTNGAKLATIEKKDLNKIKNIIKDFNKKNLICGFLNGYGNNYNITVTATADGCFKWVFSRNGIVKSMQLVQAVSGQSYNGYSTNEDTVGISCDCLF